MFTYTDQNINSAMSAEIVRKKMNKSLIFELILTFVPLVTSILCTVATLMVAGGRPDETLVIFVVTWIITFILSMIICFIIRIRTTLKAMNCCMEYFTANSDAEFVKKCSTSKTLYIISYIMPFIPVINLFTIVANVFNLVIWFSVKNRIRAIEYVKADPSRSLNSNYISTIKAVMISFVIGIGLVEIGVKSLEFVRYISVPMNANHYEKIKFTLITTFAQDIIKQVEYCALDLGVTNFTPNQPLVIDKSVKNKGCSNVYGLNKGNGWKIIPPNHFTNGYVKRVDVSADGVITITSSEPRATYQIVPYHGNIDNGEITWKFDRANSSCDELGLC